MLTQEELKNCIFYEKNLGLFFWTKKVALAVNVGDIAGSIKKEYVHIWVKSKPYMAHRLAWLYVTGEWPVGNLDHKDGNGHNNAWDNLRLATDSQNASNRKVFKNNTTGYKGVYFIMENKYRALITYENKRHHLGYFKTAEMASKAYNEFSKKLHGEFRRT
jgi:hypothetical protein